MKLSRFLSIIKLKGLSLEQKISVITLILLVIVLPLAVMVSIAPKIPLFSRANPTTPPTPPTPTTSTSPTPAPEKYPIMWVTDTVYMKADDFTIKANGMFFHADEGPVYISSDPGNPNYTTLEATWNENGVEMRLFLYFAADQSNWWATEMRIYNGENPGDWVYFSNPVPPQPLGQPYSPIGKVGFINANVTPPAEVIFENWVLLAFRNRVVPSVTAFQTPSPTPTIHPSITPTPTIIPPKNDAPVITTSGVKTGRRGKKVSITIHAYDRNGDDMVMRVNKLPPGLILGQCTTTIRLNGFTDLRCNVFGIPKQGGVYKSRFTVKDEHGAQSSKNIYFVIFPLL